MATDMYRYNSNIIFAPNLNQFDSLPAIARIFPFDHTNHTLRFIYRYITQNNQHALGTCLLTEHIKINIRQLLPYCAEVTHTLCRTALTWLTTALKFHFYPT